MSAVFGSLGLYTLNSATAKMKRSAQVGLNRLPNKELR